MRKITLTNTDIAEILSNIENTFKNNRMSGKFTYTYQPKVDAAKTRVQINFTGLAWTKMWALVRECTTEIAWHGLVHASEDRKRFDIYDILVYPQTVTGATVVTDEQKYEVWHQALADEPYNALRMQGHSHVNMGATPSGVDNTLYDNMMQTLSANSYYIFMILNKSKQRWINIIDLKHNAIYETSDVDVTVEDIDPKAWYTEQYNTYIAKPVTNPVSNYYKDYANGTFAETPTRQSSSLVQTEFDKIQSKYKEHLNSIYDEDDDEDYVSRKLTRRHGEYNDPFYCDAHPDPRVINAALQAPLQKSQRGRPRKDDKNGLKKTK